MSSTGAAAVRRWGWRAIALLATGFGLYVVTPSLLTMFDSWPRLADVAWQWFVVLAVLETASLGSLWWLTRIALAPVDDAAGSDHVTWGTAAAAQLAGNAAGKVVPGGAATGGVVQAKVLIDAGQPGPAVASSLAAQNLLTSAALLLLPVLTIPALIIGPPPARQLQLGLLVSLILATAMVTIGVIALKWRAGLAGLGRGIGAALQLVRRQSTAGGVATALLDQRDRIAAAFAGQWWRAVIAAAANRMFDYAALVAALVAFGAHARPAEVLLAYVVAQALTFIPITPGGLGFVDAGLTGLLVVIGVPTDTAVIGTLLYRLFSFWLPIPIGVAVWAGWRLRR